jgi:tetratricopeptide (TPR) repeat protein
MFEEAIEAHQKAVEVSPRWRWSLGATYVKAGRRDEALKILSELKEEVPTSWGAFGLARLYTALGEKDEAFRWLAYEHPVFGFPWIRVMPEFEPLRDDPRFDDLLRKLNLPELE